jgi:hypothetical protein
LAARGRGGMCGPDAVRVSAVAATDASEPNRPRGRKERGTMRI